MSTLSEAELIVLLKLKNEKGFNYLYDTYAPVLFGIIIERVRCGLQSGEILKTVFIKIWLDITSYSPEKGRVFTWMSSIAREESISHVNKKRSKIKPVSPSLPFIKRIK